MRGLSEAASLKSVVLQSITQEAPDTLTLSFDAAFPYKPGQSVQVLFPSDSKKRYYSIASSPTEKGRMAITVKLPVEHALTPLVTRLKIGDPIQLQGPYGSFGLPAALSGVFCFIAGGTGVAPFRSMVKF